MDAMFDENKVLCELLKSNISDNFDRRLKVHQDGLIALVGAALDKRLQDLSLKLESVHEDLGVDIGQIRLDRERHGRPELPTKTSSPLHRDPALLTMGSSSRKSALWRSQWGCTGRPNSRYA
jgi:hypothetical protein